MTIAIAIIQYINGICHYNYFKYRWQWSLELYQIPVLIAIAIISIPMTNAIALISIPVAMIIAIILIPMAIAIAIICNYNINTGGNYDYNNIKTNGNFN